MATLTIDKTDKTPGYNIQWYEGNRRRTIYLGGRRFSRKTAERLKEVVESLLYYRDNGIEIPDKPVSLWIQAVGEAIRAKLGKAGLIHVPAQHTCKELWDSFLAQKTGVKAGTIRLYEDAKKKFFGFFPETEVIDRLNRDRMTEWIASMPGKQASIATYVKQTKAVFVWARDKEKWITESPLAGIGGGDFDCRRVRQVSGRKFPINTILQ